MLLVVAVLHAACIGIYSVWADTPIGKIGIGTSLTKSQPFFGPGVNHPTPNDYPSPWGCGAKPPPLFLPHPCSSPTLQVSLCTPNENTPTESLARLVSMVFQWFHSTAYMMDDEVGSLVEKLKPQFVTKWLKGVCDVRFDVMVMCLLPKPVEFARVRSRHARWMSVVMEVEGCLWGDGGGDMASRWRGCVGFGVVEKVEHGSS